MRGSTQSNLISRAWFCVVAGILLLTGSSSATAFGPNDDLPPMTKVVSVEGGWTHFSTGRLAGNYLNAWNVGASLSLLPFGVIHNERFLHGALDGALEVGLQPAFERFNTVHQNFAGVLFKLRYYLFGLSYGPFVPWIGGSIGPGYSDLNIGRVHDDNKLKGPFMAVILGEVGVAYFLEPQKAFYVGLEAQHVSNGGLNGSEAELTTNASINTPWGMVIGFSWFFR